MIQRESNVKTLVLKTADPLFVSDHKLRIVFWNKGVEALLGFTAKEVLETPCSELVGCRTARGSNLCHGNCMELLMALRQEPQPSLGQRLRSKNGEDLWVEITTILVPSSQFGQALLVHVLRDLRHQKALEQLCRQIVATADRLTPTGERPPSAPEVAAPVVTLTAREREVMRLLATGASTETIARKLFISQRTARNHIQNVLDALQVHSRLEAVVFALRNRII